MKYKLLGLTAAVLLLLTAAVFTYYRLPEEHARVHQHLTARRDTGCDCGETELCSHLPLVIIDTGGQEIPGKVLEGKDRFGQELHSVAENGEATIPASITVIDNQDRNNHPSDESVFTTYSEFRIRGNSSRKFPKVPYLLNFVDGEGLNRDISVMGMPAHHEWVLHGPILDKSLVRNYMWYNISGEIMEYAPNCRFCELILDGSYEGLYLMVESVTVGKNCRLNLSVNAKNAEANGYLLRVDRPAEAELEGLRDVYTFSERSNKIFQDVAIRYPGQSKLTEALKKSIELDYSAFEKALYSYDHDTEKYGYWNWINIDSFVDYFIIAEFTKNTDMGSYSTYLYKEVCYVDGDLSEWTQEDVVSFSEGMELSMKYDEKFIYFLLRKDGLSPEEDTLYIPVDTTPKSGSTYCRNYGVAFERPCDFLIVIRGREESRVVVQQRYECLRSTYAYDYYEDDPYVTPPERDTPVFERIYLPLIQQDFLKDPDVTAPTGTKYETGLLRHGNANPEAEDFDSLADFIFSGDCVEIRLPWQLLNFSNPSQMMIHDDYYECYGVENLHIDEIYVGVGSAGDGTHRIRMDAVPLKGWGKKVTSHERLKRSYYILQSYWAVLDEEAARLGK